MEMSGRAVGLLAGLCLAGGAGGAMFMSRSAAPVAASEPAAAAFETPAPITEPAPAPVVEPAPVSVRRQAPVRRTTPAPERITVERAPARTVETPAAAMPSAPPAATQFEVPRTFEPVATPAAAPAAPAFEELIVSADSVIGLQTETAVTSETAQVEDEVVARVSRDIRVGDRVAIPAGSKAYGTVTSVARGGRMRDRARLGVRFDTIVLADGTRVRLDTDPIYRDGDSPTGESAAKIGGGAIGGAIIGGILGGGKGAAIGGSIGAGAGTAAVMAGGRNAATLPAGSTLTVRLLEPASVLVEP